MRRRHATPRLAVALVTVAWAALLLGASLVWPPRFGYDEARHVDMALAYAAEPTRLWAPGELRDSESSVRLDALTPADPAVTPFASMPVSARADRPSLADLGGATPAVGALPNQMVQHPPLAYWLAAAVLRVPGVDGLAWDLQVWLLRLLSVALALPVPALCWIAARRLLRAEGAARAGALALTAAALPLSIPNLARVGSSVSNDGLLLLSVSVLLVGLARVLTGDLGRRTALLVGGALVVALWTKGLALVLPVPIALAYAYAVARAAREGDVPVRSLLRAHLPVAGLLVGAGVVGGSWWLRNLVLFHAVQVDGTGPGGALATYGAPDGTGRLSDFVQGFFYLTGVRVWGGVGIPDDPSLGPVVVWGWLVVIGVATVAAVLLPAGARRHGLVLGTRARVALLALPSLLLVLGVVAYGSWDNYRQWSDEINAAQGRYLYPVVVGVAAAVAVGAARLPGTLGRWVPTLALVAALATTGASWVLLLATWFVSGSATSPADVAAGLAGLVRWSPVDPPATLALVVALPLVTAVAAVVGVAAVARAAVARPCGLREDEA